MILTDKQIEELEEIGHSEGALAMRYHLLKLAIENRLSEEDLWDEVQIYRKRRELKEEKEMEPWRYARRIRQRLDRLDKVLEKLEENE